MRSNMLWVSTFLGLLNLLSCVLPPAQLISGTMEGAAGPVTLTNSSDVGTFSMTLTQNGAFTFATAASQYNVTANSNVQNCKVTNGSGEVGGSPITDIDVKCSGQYSVSVNVTGVPTNNGNLVLNNGLDILVVSADGTYTFPGTLIAGAGYNVQVTSNPNNAQCTVTNATGSIQGNVSATVSCAGTANYFVSGVVDNLGTSITLQNSNNQETVTVINPNTHFQFPTPLEPNQSYNITVLTQPVDQVCTFVNGTGTGTAGTSKTNGLIVTCTEALRSVAISVQGLSGTVQVLNNGTDILKPSQNGAYTFATRLHDNSVFNVTVGTQPPGQACVIPNPYGQVNGEDIYNIQVNCVSPSNQYTIGGIATGLKGTVTLSNFGFDSLSVTQDGAFTFPISMANAAAYDVVITSQPPGQSCVLTTIQGNLIYSTGAGTVGGTNVNTLRLNCGDGYYVGGRISGLTGTLRLLNNISGSPADIITASNGQTTFSFPTSLPTNATYAVQVMSQPPGQTCSILGATGTTTNANITNVNITCAASTTHNYTVGGYVQGLSGALVLLNDNFDPLTITSSGNFTFPTALANYAPYDVEIVAQPAGQVCLLQDGSNTITGANVTSVQIVCQSGVNVTVPVTGLSGGNVILEILPQEPPAVVSQNGTFTFPNAVWSNTALTVNVASSPNHVQCVAVSNSGTLPTSWAPAIRCGPFYDIVRGQSAVSLVGQSGFYTSSCNAGGTTASGSTVCFPFGDAWISAVGGPVYFPDFGNNRTLVYPGIPAVESNTATVVLGQTSLAGTSSGSGSTNLSSPMGVTGASGKVAVVDTANSRVLIYNSPVTTGAAAAVVVGQTSLTSSGAACSAAGLSFPQSAIIVNNVLFVADTGNNRVTIYSPVPTSSGASANIALGQGNLTSCGPPNLLALSGTNLNAPQDVWTDGTHLLVADTGDNRVLGWSTMPTTSGARADVVLGQKDAASFYTGSGANQMSYPTSLTANTEQLFVADTLNNRVLIFNTLPKLYADGYQTPALGPTADAELGQVDFNLSPINSLGGVPGPETLHRPSGVTLNGNILIVTDTGNNRFTIYGGF